MIGWILRLLCGWSRKGHEPIARFIGRRAFHECLRCGKEFTGIVVDGHAPRRRFDGDPQRHALARRAS